MGGAEHGALAADLVEASEQELPEASGLRDLPEDRFDDLLAETGAAAVAGASGGLGHRCHPRASPEAPGAGLVAIAVARTASTSGISAAKSAGLVCTAWATITPCAASAAAPGL